MIGVLALALSSLSNPLTNPDLFPIAVWLQEPVMAAKYKAAGFNLFVGLWEGPTDKQLSELSASGMPVICDQNATGLRHKNDPTIVGWMHQDEPDNAQAAKDAVGKDTWGPCVPPQDIVAKFRAFKAVDPSRPVLLNLGQGVANDQWIGRGNGAKLDDYKTYVQGCDIASFDVYPVAGLGDPGKIALISKGLDRLEAWSAGTKRIWNCLECTAISGKAKATPEQVQAEAWSAIIHGSRGLIYFVHQFEPRFNEHALLDDPAMLASVTALNRRISGFATILNKGSRPRLVESGNPKIQGTLVRYGGDLYLFAISLLPTSSTAHFQIGEGTAQVLGEQRSVAPSNRVLSDQFKSWQFHVYQIHQGK